MLPFLPKSRPERVIRSGPDCRGTSQIYKRVDCKVMTSDNVQNAVDNLQPFIISSLQVMLVKAQTRFFHCTQNGIIPCLSALQW